MNAGSNVSNMVVGRNNKKFFISKEEVSLIVYQCILVYGLYRSIKLWKFVITGLINLV